MAIATGPLPLDCQLLTLNKEKTGYYFLHWTAFHPGHVTPTSVAAQPAPSSGSSPAPGSKRSRT